MYNLVIITPDQLRQDYLGCYGRTDIHTAHIDALAADGVVLDECYCAAPLCAPSRISFATSTYVSEHGHRNYWSEISPRVPNLVTSLKKAGYRTGMFGKNHLFTYDRLTEVWDELDEICLGNYDGHEKYRYSFSSFTLEEDHPFNITGRLTGEGERFIHENKERPFFLWLNYQDPHPAFTCPAPYDAMFDPESVTLPPEQEPGMREQEPVRNEVWRRHSQMEKCGDKEMREAIAHYMGQIRYVDDCTGRIAERLKAEGLYDNTVILFFSDHGELLGDRGMFHKIPVYYDCLSKIPVIVKYPDSLYKGTRFTGLAEEVDLAPWLLEILGLPKPATMVGTSIHGQIAAGRTDCGKRSVLCEAGGGAPTVREPIEGLTFLAPHIPTSFGPGAMVRMGSYKLSAYFDDKWELYHLETDPKELYNLYDHKEYKTVREDLTRELVRRLLGTKVRRTGKLAWDENEYPADVRFEPLESAD